MNHKSVMEILEKRFGDKAWSYNNQLLLLGKINDTEHKLHEERIHIEIDQALSDLKQLIPSEEEIMRLVYLQLCLELPKNISKKNYDAIEINKAINSVADSLAKAIRTELERKLK